MKKIIITITCTLFFFTAFGQKDFDYTFYTTKATIINVMNGTDTLNLTLFRQIKKENNIIKVINTNNTGDCQTYEVEFIGWSIDEKKFMYRIKPYEGAIYINPIYSEISIMVTGTKTIYY